jgi:hypothetical protein
VTPRRRNAIVAAAVALLAGGLVLWRCTREAPDDGFITELQVLDEDTALVVWRANYQDRGSRGWVGRVDARGRTRWVRELPSDPMTGRSLIVAGDLVAVRYSRDGADHSLIAFDLDDGRKRWDVELTRIAPGDDGHASAHLPVYLTGVVAGGRILTWAHDGVDTQLIAVDPASGELLWRRPGAYDAHTALPLGERAVVHAQVGQVELLDGGDRPVGFTAAGAGCVVDGDFYTVVDAGDGYQLVAYPGGDPARRRVIAPFQPAGPRHYQHLIGCGSYRDDLVFSLDVSSLEGAYQPPRSLVVVTDRAGAPRRTIDLGHDMRWDRDATGKRHPGAAPLSGELSRFVPYLQVTASEEEGAPERLIVLDLEEGKIAWHGPQDPGTIHMNLFHAGARWYLTTSMPAAIVAIDGATGAIAAAIVADHERGVEDPLPLQVVGDRLWLYSGAWNTFDRAPIAVLDAATLEPSFARDVEITDVTAEIREALGAP